MRVRSGSTLLTEGTDYQVFYDQAKVKILNPAYLNSANELRVEFEKNALVQVQPRKLLGVRLDYRLNKDVTIGGTALHLLENQAPGINRVNIGDEPGNNTIIGPGRQHSEGQPGADQVPRHAALRVDEGDFDHCLQRGVCQAAAGPLAAGQRRKRRVVHRRL